MVHVCSCEGFRMPADAGRAANTEARGRRTKASKERKPGKVGHAVVPGALWGFEHAEEVRATTDAC